MSDDIQAGGAGPKRVDVDGADTAAIEAAIQASGGQIYSAAPGSVRADVPSAALGALADDPRVERVHEPRTFRPDLTTQGIGQTGASVWQSNGRTGAGTKVAVVDLGFTGLAAMQAAGNLPATTNLSFCGNGGPGTLNERDDEPRDGSRRDRAPDGPRRPALLGVLRSGRRSERGRVVPVEPGVTIVNASWG